LDVTGSCNSSHHQRFMREKFFENEITEKISQKLHVQWNFHCERWGNVDLNGVSRVWQAWHMPWAPLCRGAKKLLGKIKIFIYSFLNLYFAPHTFINCKAAPTPRPHLKHYVGLGRVALVPLSIMTNLRYCDIIRGSDIATEQERSLAMSTRPRPSHAIRKDKLVLLLHFRQVDISQNLVEMSLSLWLWESDCCANNCCWGRTNLEITWTAAAHSDVMELLRWPLVPDK